MHEDRKVVLDGASPERIEARIVDGHADRRDREERDGPRLLRATLDLLDRAVNVPPRSQDDALQPRGMGPAVVGHVAVVRLVHGQLEPDVVGAGEAVDSARRDDDVDVHALDVHVGHPRVRVDVDALGRPRRALPLHTPRRAGRSLVSGGRGGPADLLPAAQPALAALGVPDNICMHAAAKGGPRDGCRTSREGLLPSGGEVLLQHLTRLVHMRVGVEDLEPVFPHWTLPVNAHPESASATPAPGTARDRKSTRLNSSHTVISYAVFCLKKKKRACARQSPPLSLLAFEWRPTPQSRPRLWR